MPNASQTSDAQESRERKRTEAVAVDVSAAEFATEFDGGPLAAAGGGTISGQAGRLHDQRLLIAQRQALARHIGHVQGNHHLQLAVLYAGPAEGSRAHSGAAEGKHSVSPPAHVPALQRQGPSEGSGVTVQIGGYQVSTCGMLASVSRLLAAQLKTEADEVPTGTAERAAAEPLIEEGRLRAASLESRAAEPLDQSLADQASAWYAEYAQAQKDLDGYKKRKAKEELESRLATAVAAQKRVENLREVYLNDLMRAAFLTEDTDLLTKISDTLSTIADSTDRVVGLCDVVHQIYEVLGNPATRAAEAIARAKQLADALTKVQTAYSAVKGGFTLLLGGSGPTESDKAFSQVATAAEAVGTASTLLGMSSAFGGYVSIYLVPAATAAVRVASRVTREFTHMMNRYSISMNQLDQVDWSVEPGGRAMWDFMVAVMRAGSSAGVPEPVPDEVSSYMVDEKDRFEAGTGGEMPTTGWWFWEDVDPEKIKYWVFRNRQNLWSMLYGSVPPPA